MLSESIKQDTVGNRIRGTNLYQNHHTANSYWGDCQRCHLHVGRRFVALRRDGRREYLGHRLVRLLFIGEAPGGTENDTGIPFTGRSGTVLDTLFDFCNAAFQFCITNTVCCQPKDVIEEEVKDYDGPDFIPPTTGKIVTVNYNRIPNNFEKNKCEPHIHELIQEIRPEGIVYLGLEAQSFKTKLPSVLLKHPAWILRQEYKVLPVRKEAHKLKVFIDGLE